MEENKKEETPKSDAMTAEDAKEKRLLINEDIRKFEQNIASLKGQIATLEYYIAECRWALADIDRREAGVAYPEPPKKADDSDGNAAPTQGPEGK
jgi:predicted RNase H-like nuclease (RuvC/YqgF family)